MTITDDEVAAAVDEAVDLVTAELARDPRAGRLAFKLATAMEIVHRITPRDRRGLVEETVARALGEMYTRHGDPDAGSGTELYIRAGRRGER